MQKKFNFVDHNIKFPELPDDTSEKGRYYTTPEGNVYPSVTTVLGSVPKPQIEAWKARVGEEEAAKVLYQAGVRGTEIHQMAEDHINGTYDRSKFSAVNRETFNSIKPIIDQNIDNIYAQEVTVYSDRLRTAGRVDLLGEWKNTLSIIDFKTSKKIKTEEYAHSYFIQESVYSACLFEMFRLKVKQIVTIIAVDDDFPIVFVKQPLQYLQEFINIRKSFKSTL